MYAWKYARVDVERDLQSRAFDAASLQRSLNYMRSLAAGDLLSDSREASPIVYRAEGAAHCRIDSPAGLHPPANCKGGKVGERKGARTAVAAGRGAVAAQLLPDIRASARQSQAKRPSVRHAYHGPQMANTLPPPVPAARVR